MKPVCLKCTETDNCGWCGSNYCYHHKKECPSCTTFFCDMCAEIDICIVDCMGCIDVGICHECWIQCDRCKEYFCDDCIILDDLGFFYCIECNNALLQ